MSCVGVIPIANGYIAIVDSENEAEIAAYQWSTIRSSGGLTAYAARKDGDGKTVLMHHQVLGRPPIGLETDHINGNGLDNRRTNLRFVTGGVNKQNTPPRRWALSPYKGVIARRAAKSKEIVGWMARIRKDNQKYHLGTFPTQEEAARTYDQAALRLYGPQARTNFGPVENIHYFDTQPIK